MKITVDVTLCVDRMVLSLQVAEQYQAPHCMRVPVPQWL